MLAQLFKKLWVKVKSEVAGSSLHEGSKGTVLPLLSASQETGVKFHCFGKNHPKGVSNQAGKLESGREAGASSGEGLSAEAPAASLATEFVPTPWQGRWGGAGKRPGRNSLWFPWPGAAEALRGL